MTWEPQRYLAFAADRLRPALDLIARVPLEAPARVVDLGCGPGNVTRILAQRWPSAQFTGVDSSRDMLARAVVEMPEADWRCADIAGWRPEAPVDLLFSNAALHWLDDHAALFPRLMQSVAPGGALAVQMPDNYAAPSHQCAYEVAKRGPWKRRLAPLLRPAPVHAPEAYFEWLAPHAARIDIWHSTYLQVMEGENPVADWTRGSLLVPLLDALPPDLAVGFEAEYRDAIAAAYPKRADGRTLFAFKRLFIVAAR